MILAADLQLTVQTDGCVTQRGIDITPHDLHTRLMKLILHDGLLDAQAGWQRLVLDAHRLRSTLRLRFAVGQHPSHRLRVEIDDVGRKQQLIVQDRTGVVLARNIFGRQHAPDTGHAFGGRAVHR
jgi:hypothetical protein